MKRALLIWNPAATTTSPGVRDVIARALSSELHIETAETLERGHARELAARAAADGEFDLVAVLGGDGTINEAVNGLAGTGVPLATIPGGGTNVLARTLGYPKDPVEATAMLIERLQRGAPPRTISLGRINGRAFAFCAGVGFDAGVVAMVEANQRAKRRLGELFFVTSALRHWMTPGLDRHPRMDVRWDGGGVEGVRILVIGNSDPYTFLGPKPFRLTPTADIERPTLDATAILNARPGPVGKTLLSAFGSGRPVRHRSVVSLRDLAAFTVSAEREIPFQVDGDLAGSATEIRVWSDPAALAVVG